MHSFLAVAETGSLSAAAARLGISQPTLGRHIRALEDHLRVELFSRHPKGLALTQAGADVLPGAQAMRAGMIQAARAAETAAGTVAGTVRITASVFMSHHVLPPILAELRRTDPAIRLVLHPDDASENLTFREADLAVRMYRPRQLDLVTRWLGDLDMGVFAARDYLARRGRPTRIADLFEHDVVGYDRSPLIRDAIAALGIAPESVRFVAASDNHATYWELVRAGCGIGFTQAHVGRADPQVEALEIADLAIPALPVWLAAQERVRHIPRVARVWTHLAQRLSAVVRAAGAER